MHKDERVTDAMVELKPCPFCGGQAMQCGNNEHNPRHWIMCRECHACPGGDVSDLCEAISGWNSRSSAEEKAVKVLEWDRFGHTHGSDLSYQVETGRMDNFGKYQWRSRIGLGKSGWIFDSAQSAKAAAQADYETRIRAALVDVPAVESEPVAERCVGCDGYNCDDGCAYPDPPRTTPVPALVGEDGWLLSLTNEQKEITLLRIIDAMGGRTDSSDYPGNWLTWFCSDEIHNVQDDTFNRCNDKGWLHTTHDTSFDTSTTTLTAAGRNALTRKASTEEVGGSTSVAKDADHG